MRENKTLKSRLKSLRGAQATTIRVVKPGTASFGGRNRSSSPPKLFKPTSASMDAVGRCLDSRNITPRHALAEALRRDGIKASLTTFTLCDYPVLFPEDELADLAAALTAAQAEVRALRAAAAADAELHPKTGLAVSVSTGSQTDPAGATPAPAAAAPSAELVGLRKRVNTLEDELAGAVRVIEASAGRDLDTLLVVGGRAGGGGNWTRRGHDVNFATTTLSRNGWFTRLCLPAIALARSQPKTRRTTASSSCSRQGGGVGIWTALYHPVLRTRPERRRLKLLHVSTDFFLGKLTFCSHLAPGRQ